MRARALTARRASAAAICALLVAVGGASATESITGDFAVPGGHSVSVTWPADWSLRASASKEWPEGTLELSHPTARDFLLLLSPLIAPNGASAASSLPDASSIRDRVTAIARDELATAVEREVAVSDFEGGSARGSYFVLTDAAPKPGEFERMAQGILLASTARFTFTALLHEADPPQFAQALEILRSFAPSAEGTLRFAVPKAPFVLELAQPDLRLNISQIGTEGAKGYFMAAHESPSANFPVASFFIEPAVKCATSADCADLIERGGFAHIGEVRDVRRFVLGDISIVECHLPKLAGRRVKQQHWFAQFVVDGYWVDAHLSKVLYRPEDRAVLEAIVKAVEFVPRQAVSEAAAPTLEAH